MLKLVGKTAQSTSFLVSILLANIVERVAFVYALTEKSVEALIRYLTASAGIVVSIAKYSTKMHFSPPPMRIAQQ